MIVTTEDWIQHRFTVKADEKDPGYSDALYWKRSEEPSEGEKDKRRQERYNNHLAQIAAPTVAVQEAPILTEDEQKAAMVASLQSTAQALMAQAQQLTDHALALTPPPVEEAPEA